MITEFGLRWVLTVVFAGTALYSLFALVSSPTRTGSRALPRPVARVGYSLHVVMSVAMIAMAWPWGMSIPLVPQIIVFALAAGWFLVVAVVRWRRPGGEHDSRAALIAHAAMMGAMVWMLAVMPITMTTGSGATGCSAHHAEMGHCTLPAESPSAQSIPADSVESLPLAVWMAGIGIAVGFTIAGLWWGAKALDHARFAVHAADSARSRRPSSSTTTTVAASTTSARLAFPGAEHGCHAVMSIGMAVMTAAIVL